MNLTVMISGNKSLLTGSAPSPSAACAFLHVVNGVKVNDATNPMSL